MVLTGYNRPGQYSLKWSILVSTGQYWLEWSIGIFRCFSGGIFQVVQGATDILGQALVFIFKRKEKKMDCFIPAKGTHH